MTFFELFLIGIGLSMDAFAVSICKGLSMQKIDKKYTLCIGLFFGGFQALMPLTGYLLGSRFSGYIERFDHWIAFVLLALIGFNMIKESREEEKEEEKPYAGRRVDSSKAHSKLSLYRYKTSRSGAALQRTLRLSFLRACWYCAAAIGVPAPRFHPHFNTKTSA